MVREEYIDLINTSVCRLIWATKTAHVFLSIFDPASKKECDPDADVLAGFAGARFTAHPYSEAQIVYPNGVLLSSDLSSAGVWISVQAVHEDADGNASVTMRFYATHLKNFEKTYVWRPSQAGWQPEGGTKRVGSGF